MRVLRIVGLVLLLVVSAGCIFDTTTKTETRVTEVVDGDTVRVNMEGSVETIRVIGIDTPETRGAVSPSEFGLADTEQNRACLREVANEATAYMKESINDRNVTLARDAATDNRGSFGRLLRYVETDDGDVGEALVRNGYARVYDESPFTREATYDEAASEARANNRGFWGCDNEAPPLSVRISMIHADAAGDDRTNLNDEYIIITNNRNSSVSTAGWVLTDEAGHRYEFPSRTVAPDTMITVRTGSGQDTADILYWSSSSPIWNNGGDTVRITKNQTTVVERSYN